MAMLDEAIRACANETWDDIVPVLHDYIAIPNVSPVFDPDWRANGHMAEAVDLIAGWCRAQPIDGLTLEVVELDGRTPVILMEIPAIGAGSSDDTVLLYGHLDKQPEMEGWREGLGPWTPVLEGDRLYGRGGADDGYAAFASLTAIRCGACRGRFARPVRGAHRVERGVGLTRPAVLHGGPGRPCRHTEPRHLPRFRLPRLRPAVGHHVVAGARVGHAAGRHRHRRAALRRRVGHGAVDVPDRSHAARPGGGRTDRRDPRAGTHRRDPGEPGRARRATRPPRSGASPTTIPSSTAPVPRPTTRPSSSCRAPGTPRSASSAPKGCPASLAPATCCGRARRSSCRSVFRRRVIRWLPSRP